MCLSENQQAYTFNVVKCKQAGGNRDTHRACPYMQDIIINITISMFVQTTCLSEKCITTLIRIGRQLKNILQDKQGNKIISDIRKVIG